MSILIKGMEMPENCAWCRFLQSNDPIPKRERFCGIDTTNNIHDYKPDKGCPLVPVPPHGRLIDADALEQNAQERMLICNQNDNQFQKPYEVMRAIALAPTIIQEEDG